MEKSTGEGGLKKLADAARQKVQDTGLPLVADEKTADPIYVSSRDLPLKYLVPVAKVKPFFDGLQEGRVMATRCAKCGAKYFPPRADCAACRSSELEYFELSTEAVLMAYTVIEVKPYSFSGYGDYAVAIGRLPEGLNVVAWLKGVDKDKISVGMKLNLRVARRELDGVCTYNFEPA
jgi:uncharacterized OB-fold protein